jgi:magnesium transporter
VGHCAFRFGRTLFYVESTGGQAIVIHAYSLENGASKHLEGEWDGLFPGADSPPAVVWLNLENPTPEECGAVGARYGIAPDHLHAALDINERPRVEYEDGVLLVILRIPISADKQNRVLLRTCPVAVILQPDLAITVCLKEHLTENLLNRKFPGKGPHLAWRLALTLFLRASAAFIENLRLMDEHVGHIERTLQESMQNQELLRMLHVEKSLIYFLTALKGNHAVMEKLHGNFPPEENLGEKDLLEDALIENKQAIDMAEIFMQITVSLGDAFGAIVSNNLNKVMKVLTGLTIVFMVPSIIGALYGMNVPLPGQESPFAFAGLCGACLGISGAVYWFLRKMRWM